MSVLDNLNNQQLEAVKTFYGPLLILAGAGSGKTRVITRRIAYGMEQRVITPDNFLAVTFTNKAAGEMQKRVTELTGLEGRHLWIKTFHSACAMILRRDGEFVGLSRFFSIYDSKDQLKIIKEIIKENGTLPTDITPKRYQAVISNAKSQGIGYKQLEMKGSSFEQEFIYVYEAYDTKLRESKGVDFDDLLFLTVRLFAENEKIRKIYANKFEFIMVDEYQDTNHIQYKLIKLLTMDHDNICVVGDDDQSIYNWRGADISNILNFEQDYPNTKVIKLEQNYRSTQNILNVAAAVIQNNEERIGKNIWSEIDSGDKPLSIAFENGYDEAREIISIVIDKLSEGINPREIAIFYRTNRQSRLFEENLIKNGITYQLVGGTKFYERKEIKDFLAYLILAVNGSDLTAFKRAIAVPAKGIGPKSVERILNFARLNRITPVQATLRSDEIIEVKAKKAKQNLKKFGQLLQQVASTRTPIESFQIIFDEAGFEKFYETEEDRLENIDELKNSILNWFELHQNGTLEDFMTDVALLGSIDLPEGDQSGIQLMTIHNSKGLEFDLVFLTGLEDGLFPHFLSEEDDQNVEEERRLFYVGVTRARTELFLTHAEERSKFGRTEYNEKSRFLEELPDALIEERESKSSRSFFSSSSDFKKVSLTFTKGDQVIHPEYGIGEIIERSDTGTMISVRVDFHGEICSFIEKFSKLKKL